MRSRGTLGNRHYVALAFPQMESANERKMSAGWRGSILLSAGQAVQPTSLTAIDYLFALMTPRLGL